MPQNLVESAGGGLPQSAAFEALVNLAASVRGCGELNDQLRRLGELYRAERVLIARVERASHRLIAVADRNAGRLLSDRRPPCVAVDLLRAVDLVLMPGKVLFLSSLIEGGEAEMVSEAAETLARSRLRDVAVVILEVRADCYDVIELQFDRPAVSIEALVASMAPALSTCWKSRLPGTAQATAERTRLRPVTENETSATDLLSPENPASLSRSEFRICALLREGVPTKRIACELAIRPTTLRAHLHSIYAKTGAAGQVELVHRLFSRGDMVGKSDRFGGLAPGDKLFALHRGTPN